MPVAIDTSVLISAERAGGIAELLPLNEEGPYYIPAMAAAEFLVGTHPPGRPELRNRAALIYQSRFVLWSRVSLKRMLHNSVY